MGLCGVYAYYCHFLTNVSSVEHELAEKADEYACVITQDHSATQLTNSVLAHKLNVGNI